MVSLEAVFHITVSHSNAYTVVKGDKRFQEEAPFFGVP